MARDRLGAGLDYPKRVFSTEEERASEKKAATAERVEQRAAHAARMLARAETRLKHAKTLEKKWRVKVMRYERIAAKREES